MATYSRSKKLIQSSERYGGKTILAKEAGSVAGRVRVRFKLSTGTKWFKHPLKAFVILIAQTT